LAGVGGGRVQAAKGAARHKIIIIIIVIQLAMRSSSLKNPNRIEKRKKLTV
jgi:hypothetical protein